MNYTHVLREGAEPILSPPTVFVGSSRIMEIYSDSNLNLLEDVIILLIAAVSRFSLIYGRLERKPLVTN